MLLIAQYAHDVVLKFVRRRFNVMDVVWTSKTTSYAYWVMSRFTLKSNSNLEVKDRDDWIRSRLSAYFFFFFYFVWEETISLFIHVKVLYYTSLIYFIYLFIHCEPKINWITIFLKRNFFCCYLSSRSLVKVLTFFNRLLNFSL